MDVFSAFFVGIVVGIVIGVFIMAVVLAIGQIRDKDTQLNLTKGRTRDDEKE